MARWIDSLQHIAANNSWHRWAVALGAGALLFFALLTLRSFFRRASAKREATPDVEFMEVPLLMGSHTNALFLTAFSVYVGLMFVDMPDKIASRVQSVMVIVACWQVGIWASTGAVAWIDRRQQESLQHNRAAAGTLGVVGVVVRMIIWIIVLLLTLDNLGVKITSLVAGLGIGGVAIALAVQNVLGDLFASLAITFDKPFIVGDALGIDDIGGTVEQIGLKTTRLRSNTGEQIVLANADLLKARVHNYGRMNERRVVLTISVTYDTLHDKLERIPSQLRQIIESQSQMRFERVHFARFSGVAIEFEAVYVVTTSDYNVYMDTQQAINLAIHEYFQREGIQFAQTTPRLVFPQAPAADTRPA